jgi:opacity protein-like surface antigen
MMDTLYLTHNQIKTCSMKRASILILFLAFAAIVSAQRFHIGVFGGVAAYNGDLTDKIYPKKVTNGAIGITANYELTDNIMLRGGYTYAVVGGADRYSSKPSLVARNLSFETAIHEFSLIGEYYLLKLNENRISPYAFAGLAIYRFNPYAFDGGTDKIYLKPLSTEGQGLPGYADREPYSLTQAAIPVGAGVKFAVTDNLRIGLELGLRKLFTDYLDDVSTTYAAPADLLAGRGQLSVDMSYRGDDVGNPAYPDKGAQRGSSAKKDTYYFTGLHLTYRLGGNNGGGGGRIFGGGGGRKGNKNMGCPVNVY